MKRTVFLFIVFSFTVALAFSVPLENIVSSAHASLLRSNDELIVETQLRTGSSPLLLPQYSELQRIVTAAIGSLRPNMMIESLYLYKKPLSFHTTASVWDTSQMSGVYNQATAISTLTGIQYYSASRRAMRTFYEYSSVVDGPQSRNPQEDPVFSQPPFAMTLYARQRDLTFGDNIYRYDYSLTRDAVIFIQENVTSLSYGIIPVIGRGKLQSVMAVIDCGDSILIYTVSLVSALSLPGLNDRIRDSFTNRAEAVLTWFTGRLDSELFR